MRVVEQGLKVVAAKQPWCAQIVLLVGVPYGDKPGSSRGGVVLQGTCRMQVPGSKPPVALDSPVNVGVQQDLGGQLTREGTEALDPQHVSAHHHRERWQHKPQSTCTILSSETYRCMRLRKPTR